MAIAVLGWIGHGLLFTSFITYDDEGYILLSLRNQIEHGGLYDQVYTQYGPFFYAVLGGLSTVVQFEWNHISGRWFTLGTWLAFSGLCGILVWRCRQAWVAAVFTTVSVFAMTWIMQQEPVHPGGLISVLVALAAWVGAECIRRDNVRKFAVVIGALGACVALTKINVGAFLLMAGGLWFLATQGGRLRVPALVLALLAAAVAPFLLMCPLLDQAWVSTFAMLAAMSSVSAVAVTSVSGKGRSTPAHVAWFVGSVLVATLMVIVWALTQGSTLHGLLRGVILAPLQHPDVYSFQVRWRPLVVPTGLAGLSLVVAWALRRESLGVLHAVAFARVAVALTTVFAMLPWANTSVAALALCYGVPAAGVFAIPLRDTSEGSEALIRPWLALLLVLQSMKAFPIAGSQLNWGTFLWIPLMVFGLMDAVDFWAARVRAKRSRALGVSLAVLGCVLVAIQTGQYFEKQRSRASTGVALGLHGAENLVLPRPVASALHVIAANARESAGTLFSLPGVFSFNLWAEKPTPTLRNATQWFSLLSEGEQLEIAQAMAADPRACFVLERPLIAFLAKKGAGPRGPLVGYLENGYKQAVEVDGISLWVRREREIPTLFCVARREGGAEASRVGINLPPMTEAIAKLEAVYWDGASQPVSPGAASSSDVLNTRILPLEAELEVGGLAASFSWPLPPGDARRLTFDLPSLATLPDETKWIFRFAAEDGRTLGFARFAR